MSDWSDGLDFTIPDWTSGFDLPTGSDPTGGGWTSGQDLPGGADTGLPVGPGSSFNLGGGGSGMLASLAKAFGLTKKDGSLDLSSLLPLLGIGAGAFTGYHATNKATDQMLNAINQSSQLAKDTLGQNQALYQPYRDAGLQALTKMQNLPPSNLAGQFGPLAGNYNSLGSGKGMSLAKMSGGR